MIGLRFVLGLLLILVLGAAFRASAEGPPEEVPAPRPLAPPVLPAPRPLLPLVGPQPPVPPEFGQRSVWQFYRVDRFGRFRPLVVQTPYGSFYRYNGHPYSWGNGRQAPFLPFIVE
jgi:hypothetical protein